MQPFFNRQTIFCCWSIQSCGRALKHCFRALRTIDVRWRSGGLRLYLWGGGSVAWASGGGSIKIIVINAITRHSAREPAFQIALRHLSDIQTTHTVTKAEHDHYRTLKYAEAQKRLDVEEILRKSAAISPYSNCSQLFLRDGVARGRFRWACQVL